MNEEIILVNKPKGITSFDVIRIFRKKLGIKKIGHAGTLDPMSTGLMILGIGKGTKKLTELMKLDKTYEADILIGVSTDSFDIEGQITEDKKIDNLDEKLVIETLKLLEGVHEYEVPKFSAKKVQGKKLYEMARKGIDFKPPLKRMHIYKAEFISLKKLGDHFILKAKFDVSSGTYIRTLAVELGKLLKLPSTLYALTRTRIGEFKLEDAVNI